MGEKPPFRRTHSAATVSSTSAGLATWFMSSTTEGAAVSAGDVLSMYDPSTEASAFSFYVLSVSSSSVTAINGYDGAPSVSASTGLDSKLLEQNAPWTGYDIFEAIDTVMANLLWPWVYDEVSATIATPNLASYQNEVPAEVEEIIRAWQVIGPDKLPIPVTHQPYRVHTTISSTGKLAEFGYINGTTTYYTYRAKYAEADEADTELTHLIALGAAAILLGASMSETTLEGTKADNAEALGQRSGAGDRIWRDFLTLRQSMAEEQVGQLPNKIVFSRG